MVSKYFLCHVPSLNEFDSKSKCFEVKPLSALFWLVYIVDSIPVSTGLQFQTLLVSEITIGYLEGAKQNDEEG